MPRVSIVIPSYNHAAFLRPCLASIQVQTFENWEIVLVDDGSSDGSVAIAQELAATEPRVRVFQNEQNLGTYGTEARGTTLSKGDFVAVMNSDDVWEPNKLATQLTLLDRHPELPLAYTLGWMIDATGATNEEDVHGDWPTEPVQELLPHLLSENRVLASSVLFRKAFARFDASLRYSGDWVSLLRASKEAKIGCVAARLSHWRQHDTNSYTSSPQQVNEEVRVRKSILADSRYWFVDRVPQESIRHGLGLCSFHLAALHVLQGDQASARDSAIFALRLMQNRKSALKRLMATTLPLATARQRLWPGQGGVFVKRSVHELIRW